MNKINEVYRRFSKIYPPSSRFVPESKIHADPCIVAGPTCDSADVLYEAHQVEFPDDLATGDGVIILNCGAYTSTYSSVCFNGFPPLAVITI